MKKILVVEDEPQLQQVYKKKLTEEGFEVFITASATDSLELAKKQKPDVVLLDIILPNTHLNGFDILEQIKRNPDLQHIPVLVLTNLDSERKVAMTIGAQDYLVKAETPIEEVVNKIKSLLSSSL